MSRRRRKEQRRRGQEGSVGGQHGHTDRFSVDFVLMHKLTSIRFNKYLPSIS